MALNLTRKTTGSVLKSLRNMVKDLDLIAQEESNRMDANTVKIEILNNANTEHRKERDLAEKVANNLSELLGEPKKKEVKVG